MQSKQFVQFIRKTLLLLWAFFAVTAFISFPGRISYLYWSKLDDLSFFYTSLSKIELPTYIFDLFRSFISISIFSFACISAGTVIVHLLRLHLVLISPSKFQLLALFGTSFLLGHAFFSTIFLLLGSIYRLSPVYVITAIAIGAISGIGPLRRYFTQASLNLDKPFDTKSEKAIFWLSIIILFLTLLNSSARLSYDSVAVYFSDAKLTAMTNHIQFFTDDSFVVSIFQTAIQFSALIQIFGDQTARLFSWISGVVIIIFSIALAERVGVSKKGLLIIFATLLTSTAFLDLMGDGKVDLTSTALAVAAIYWMTIESQNHTIKNKMLLLIIGLFAGLAIVARPFNFILLGLFIILYYSQKAFFQRESRNYNLFIVSLFWIGLGATGVGIFHLFENWIIMGNPLAFISNAANVDSTAWQWAVDPNQLLIIRLLYPFSATFINNAQSLGNISPLFIALLPIVLVNSTRMKIKISGELKDLTIISVISLLFWVFLLFTVFEIRYVIFLWVIIFMPFAEMAANILTTEDNLLRNSSYGLIMGLLLFNVLRTPYIAINTYAPIDKQGNPQCFDERFCQFMRPVNEIASPGDRVLALNAFRYYLRSDLFACSTTHTEYRVLKELSHQDTKSFWEEVYRQGYKYITYEYDYTTRHLHLGFIPGLDNTPDWIKLEPIYGKPEDYFIAYMIKTVNPPIQVKKTCQKNTSGIWEVQTQ